MTEGRLKLRIREIESNCHPAVPLVIGVRGPVVAFTVASRIRIRVCNGADSRRGGFQLRRRLLSVSLRRKKQRPSATERQAC